MAHDKLKRAVADKIWEGHKDSGAGYTLDKSGHDIHSKHGAEAVVYSKKDAKANTQTTGLGARRQRAEANKWIDKHGKELGSAHDKGSVKTMGGFSDKDGSEIDKSTTIKFARPRETALRTAKTHGQESGQKSTGILRPNGEFKRENIISNSGKREY